MPVEVTVEDGTGKPNANSYASVATADAYFGSRPRSDAWRSLTAEQRGRLLIHATRLLDASFVWDGRKLSSAQALEFPRYPEEMDAQELPGSVFVATCELAAQLNLADITADASNAQFSKIEVGPIKLEMAPAAQQQAQIPSFIRNLVAQYGTLRGRSLNVRRVRA